MARRGRVPGRSKKGRGFDPDYSYVIKDLRRIGTLTAVFLAGMVILSFILR